MGGDPKTPGTPGPDQPHVPEDVYGGVWSPGDSLEDTSGRGSAPRAPGQPAHGRRHEPQSFKPKPPESGAPKDNAKPRKPG
jgi:hypothetical protein